MRSRNLLENFGPLANATLVKLVQPVQIMESIKNLATLQIENRIAGEAPTLTVAQVLIAFFKIFPEYLVGFSSYLFGSDVPNCL